MTNETMPRTCHDVLPGDSTIATIKKTVRLGTVDSGNGRKMSVYCRIEFDGVRLSICGVEGPLPSGNAIGSCGQIDGHLKPEDFHVFAPGWNRAKVARFFDIWSKWHLNDMQAGTPEQTEELAKHKFPGYPVNHYKWACGILREAGLLTVPNPIPAPQDSVSREWPSTYTYGHGWLTVEVPADVIAWLVALPNTDKTPAWV